MKHNLQYKVVEEMAEKIIKVKCGSECTYLLTSEGQLLGSGW
jgi:hypothetical protein